MGSIHSNGVCMTVGYHTNFVEVVKKKCFFRVFLGLCTENMVFELRQSYKQFGDGNLCWIIKSHECILLIPTQKNSTSIYRNFEEKLRRKATKCSFICVLIGALKYYTASALACCRVKTKWKSVRSCQRQKVTPCDWLFGKRLRSLWHQLVVRLNCVTLAI